MFRAIGIETPISIRDCSYIRLNLTGITDAGTLTCHAPICAKDSPTIVAKISPLIAKIEMADKLVDAHRKKEYCIFDDDKSIYAEWEKIAREDKREKPEEQRAIILDTRENFEIHKDSDLAKFFWEDTREDYFEKCLRREDVLSGKNLIPCWQIPVKIIDSANGTIINSIKIGHPIGYYDADDAFLSATKSRIEFNVLRLNEDNSMFGVLKEKTRPEFSGIDELNSRIISNALRKREAFQYAGVLYVPVRLN